MDELYIILDYSLLILSNILVSAPAELKETCGSAPRK